MGVINGLEARVAKPEADAATGSDVNTNWVAGPGATIEFTYKLADGAVRDGRPVSFQ